MLFPLRLRKMYIWYKKLHMQIHKTTLLKKYDQWFRRKQTQRIVPKFCDYAGSYCRWGFKKKYILTAHLKWPENYYAYFLIFFSYIIMFSLQPIKLHFYSIINNSVVFSRPDICSYWNISSKFAIVRFKKFFSYLES